MTAYSLGVEIAAAAAPSAWPARSVSPPAWSAAP